MKRSSRCTDQLSKSMDESCGIKDLRWGIAWSSWDRLQIGSWSIEWQKVSFPRD
jgi:hypothetical protein